MPQHSRLSLTIDERLSQLELDMSAVHDALARLSDRLELVMQAVTEREKSHVEVLDAQVQQVDAMLATLRDEAPTAHEPAEGVVEVAVPMESSDHNLLS